MDHCRSLYWSVVISPCNSGLQPLPCSSADWHVCQSCGSDSLRSIPDASCTGRPTAGALDTTDGFLPEVVAVSSAETVRCNPDCPTTAAAAFQSATSKSASERCLTAPDEPAASVLPAMPLAGVVPASVGAADDEDVACALVCAAPLALATLAALTDPGNELNSSAAMFASAADVIGELASVGAGVGASPLPPPLLVELMRGVAPAAETTLAGSAESAAAMAGMAATAVGPATEGGAIISSAGASAAEADEDAMVGVVATAVVAAMPGIDATAVRPERSTGAAVATPTPVFATAVASAAMVAMSVLTVIDMAVVAGAAAAAGALVGDTPMAGMAATTGVAAITGVATTAPCPPTNTVATLAQAPATMGASAGMAAVAMAGVAKPAATTLTADTTGALVATTAAGTVTGVAIPIVSVDGAANTAVSAVAGNSCADETKTPSGAAPVIAGAGSAPTEGMGTGGCKAPAMTPPGYAVLKLKAGFRSGPKVTMDDAMASVAMAEAGAASVPCAILSKRASSPLFARTSRFSRWFSFASREFRFIARSIGCPKASHWSMASSVDPLGTPGVAAGRRPPKCEDVAGAAGAKAAAMMGGRPPGSGAATAAVASGDAVPLDMTVDRPIERLTKDLGVAATSGDAAPGRAAIGRRP